MATSRTGTGKWKRLRSTVLAQAQAGGIDRCPDCGVNLDYERGRQPNSAEVDHIVPHSLGGADVVENTRVTCRHCNISKGNGRRKRRTRVIPEVVEPDTAVRW